MASVRINDVVKTFADTQVVKGVSIDIASGEFVSLVGPSGCGKSTLLRMIAGLETISGGEIELDGRVVNALPAKDRDIAMVFQNYALYPHMTVRQNLSFALEMRRAHVSQIGMAVTRAAEILDLTHLLDRYPRQLSGGQQQRVAMGRAIVRDPQVFLFDEPLSNLDAKLRVHMRTEIKDLHERLKTTTIYVTHDQVEAMTMSDRIVVMRGGIVEQVGTPLDLYDAPVNAFVGTFIGSPAMNLLAGTVAADGKSVLLADGQSLACSGAAQANLPVQIGLRPEHLAIAEQGLVAKVVVVEPTGAETLVVIELAGQRVSVIARDRPAVRRGDMISIQPEPGRLHLFDATTGMRL